MDFSSIFSSSNISAGKDLASGNGNSKAVESAAMSFAQSNTGGLTGNNANATLAGAASGDPKAIAAIANDPGKVVDYLKDYNNIAIGLDVAKAFSAKGVGADFFSKFPFASFLDNSSGHWKSREGLLRGMKPEQALAWYIKGINEGSFGYGEVEQYAGFLGEDRLGGHRIRYDQANLSYEMAALWNKTIDDKYYQGQEVSKFDNTNGYRKRSRFVFDLEKTKDFAEVVKSFQAQAKANTDAINARKVSAAKDLALQTTLDKLSNNATPDNSNKTYIIIGVVAAVVIIVALILKK